MLNAFSLFKYYSLLILSTYCGPTSSSVDLFVNLFQKSELGSLAQVEFSAEVLHDVLWQLSFEHLDVLDVLATVELNLEDANWLLLWHEVWHWSLLLHSIVSWGEALIWSSQARVRGNKVVQLVHCSSVWLSSFSK